MKKKLFTIAIALCMVFTMIPVGVFQIETAWAAHGDTPASVKVGGVEMVGNNVTYYKNDGTEGSADDYNAMYDKKTNTLTLKGFTYNGTAIGIEADGALNIVVVGKNNTINSTAHGIWTQDDLTISGTSKNRDKLMVTSSEADAIFAYDSYWAYAESITISNVDIEALSNASVGICASSTVEITDSHVVSTGAKFGIQGGFFNRDQENGSGNTGAITIVRSYIKAEATSTTIGEAKALEEVVTVNGESYDNSKKEKVVIIGESHEHYLCGTECKAIGDHQMEESKITFNKKIWMDGETLKIDDAAWTKDTTSNVERYKLPEGSYYLDDNIELDASILTEGSVNLCLNGNTITGAAQGQVITVGKNSEFSLSDCRADDKQGSITHKTSVLGKGVYNTGEFFLYGGNITGNDSDSSKTNFNGGGVTNHNGATFIMYGGSITGNKATSGAGVYNSAQDTYPTKDTVFKMYGGTISGNQASYMGGGVLNQGDFTMQGGSIGGTEDSEKNTARIGGGVHISSQWASTAGTFTMEAGKIVGNTATENGGGVFVEVKKNGSLIGTFNVSGNVNITGNKVNGEDDNVYLGMSTDRTKTASIEIGGTLTGSQKIGVKTAKTPTGGDDTVTIATGAKSGDENYFVSDDSNYVVAYDNGKLVLKTNLTPPATEHKHYLCGTNHTEVGDHTSDEETKFTAWTRTDSLPDTAGNYYLTDDVTLTTTVKYPGKIGDDYCSWDVPDGVVLCLNGKNITMKNPDGMKDDVDVIKVSAQFALTDCKTGDAQGKITHATDSSNSKYEGKGVKVLGGTFNMYGGIITGNTSNYDTGGSGVCVVSDETKTSEFKLYGGTITGNTAKNGGGVEVSKYIDEQPAVFYMYGGNIIGNTATVAGDWKSYGNGGGVYVSHMAEFVMSGGAISGNTAKQFGGGVFASAFAKHYKYGTSNAAKLKISGNAVIKNNTADSSTNNVYLDSSTTEFDTINSTLTIIGDLTGEIGVTAAAKPPVVIATGATKNTSYSTYIKSDNKEYTVARDKANGTLVLKLAGTTETKFTIIFDANGGTVDTASATTADDGTLASLPIPTREGYTFKGWYTEATGGMEIEDGHKFTDNGTIYAHWTKNGSSGGGHSYTQRPTIIADGGADTLLTFNGRTLTIAAKDGYEITDVLLNGVSKGAVTELTGLRTGDKVEVKTAKKAEPADPAADKNAKLIKGVENTTIALKSKLTKNGNVLLTWTKSKGYKVDRFEIYRSVKKSSGYGRKAFFTTKDGSWSKYLNTKELKAGKTYYYKVRGVRVIDGKEYYTQWSNKAWRTIK